MCHIAENWIHKKFKNWYLEKFPSVYVMSLDIIFSTYLLTIIDYPFKKSIFRVNSVVAFKCAVIYYRCTWNILIFKSFLSEQYRLVLYRWLTSTVSRTNYCILLSYIMYMIMYLRSLASPQCRSDYRYSVTCVSDTM